MSKVGARAQNTTIPVTLSVPESVVGNLEERAKGADLNTAVKGLLEEFLIAFSGGAVVITPQDITRISKAVGEKVDTSAKIVKAAESGAGRKGSEYEFMLSIDPCWLPSVNEIARGRNSTVEEVIRECWQIATMNGWFYSIQPNCLQFAFNEEDKRRVSEAMGKTPLTGRDIAEFIAGKQAA